MNVHNFGTNTSVRFIVDNPTRAYVFMTSHPHLLRDHDHGHHHHHHHLLQPTNQNPPHPHSPHPIHAHGLNMYILSSGPGLFDASSTRSLEALADNPPRRDVQNVQPGGHIVVQMDVKNPGIWPFHCHIAWHASAGFFSQMLFLPDDIQAYASEVPESVAQTCREWREYTASGEVVNQIDSGL